MGFIGDVVGFLTTPFEAAAGWAWDTVVDGITDWVTRGVIALLMGLWNFMGTASSPTPDNAWFYSSTGSPFRIAVQIGIVSAGILVVLGIIRAVAAGSPGAVMLTVGRDLPLAVFGTVTIVGLSAVAIDITDGFSDYVWDQTRDDAEAAFSNIVTVMMAGAGGLFFAGPLLGIVMIVVMLFMWVVLLIRESLIYLVIIYAVAFGFPSMLFAPLRDTSKKVLELLVALIIAKPVMILALGVGFSALGGIGATGVPGDGIGDNAARELGTMVVGVVVFGLAAFMPYLTWRLMPVVAAAVVAQGIASSPTRGVTQAAQLQYYGASAMRRLSGNGTNRLGAADAGTSGQGGAGATGSGAAGTGGPSGGPTRRASSLAGGGAAGAGTAAAAPASGPAAPAVAAAAATQRATRAASSAATSAVETSMSSTRRPEGELPPADRRGDVRGG